LNLKSKTKEILSFKDFTTVLAPGQINILHFDEQEKVAGFIELLLGIPDSFDGAVLVDGLPIREVEKAKWRQEVSVYTGSDDLTFGTLRENIVYNAGEEGIEKVIAILHEMGIADLVFSASDGLNAVSLPGGQNLNGRIAELFPLSIMLARAPRLLIIKDSIQNLSPEEKILLINYIKSKSGEITILVFSSDETWAAA
jgi:ABC-type multidrug transport system fused ATPase/permease subunit